MTGSTRVARTPGIEAAMAATMASRADTATKVSGSDGVTPKRSVAIRRVRSQAPTRRELTYVSTSRPSRATSRLMSTDSDV
jgi:hypothetical protein